MSQENFVAFECLSMSGSKGSFVEGNFSREIGLRSTLRICASRVAEAEWKHCSLVPFTNLNVHVSSISQGQI